MCPKEAICLPVSGCLWVLTLWKSNWMWVSELLLFNANSAIFQLYHGDFNSASSLKQQSAGRYVAPFGHIILIPSQPVFVLTP